MYGSFVCLLHHFLSPNLLYIEIFNYLNKNISWQQCCESKLNLLGPDAKILLALLQVFCAYMYILTCSRQQKPTAGGSLPPGLPTAARHENPLANMGREAACLSVFVQLCVGDVRGGVFRPGAGEPF